MDADDDRSCAQCGGPLPAPIERPAVVHGREGEILATCSTACQAELVVALAGRAKPGGRSGAGRMK